MAPMAVHQPHALKRTSSHAQFDIPAAKKQHFASYQHHKAEWDPQREFRKEAPLEDEHVASELLTRSLSLALEAVGCEGADAGVMEGFRLAVEEFMAHFLSDVRRCMLSSRRIRAIPADFLQALHTHQLSLRALLPHLDPPVPPTKSQYPLERASPDPESQQAHQTIHSLFAEASHTQSFIPKHFPHLPDKHTYQATPDFARREEDSRKLRERAAEEARLGEQALRKLVTAETAAASKREEEGTKPLSARQKRHQAWLETMAAVSQEQEKEPAADGEMMDYILGKDIEGKEGPASLLQGHMSSAVNWEKKFWRKPGRGRIS